MFGAFSRTASANPQKIEEILSRGVEDVFVLDNLRKRLLSGKKLRIKFGIDPTGASIHIGRATVLRKLKKFQDLGHTIVCIVGDFTAQIGDPSDKLLKRPMLSRQQIVENMKTYREQIGKVLDVSKVEFYHNSSWFGGLTLKELSELAEIFSVGQMLERRNFKDRYTKGEEISLREFLYPLLQGYDSFKVRSDVEVAGFDQLFNIKAGRVVQKHYSMPEQDVLTTSMLEGLDGRKMSTTWGNVISLTDTPEDMFGKVMSVQDSLIAQYFLLATDMPVLEIETIKESLKTNTVNPRDVKLRLANTITTLYHGEKFAQKAQDHFINVFSKGAVPEAVLEVKVKKGELLPDIALGAGVVTSKTEWRRLVDDGAVSILEKNEKISDPNFTIKETAVFKIGKLRFIKLVVS